MGCDKYSASVVMDVVLALLSTSTACEIHPLSSGEVSQPVPRQGAAKSDTFVYGQPPGADTRSDGNTSIPGDTATSDATGATVIDAMTYDAPDASICTPLPVVFSPSLFGGWDCALDGYLRYCAFPAPDAEVGCREDSPNGGYIYRTRECWEQWHPGIEFGRTVNFSREFVATGCVAGSCAEHLIYQGAVACPIDSPRQNR